MLATFNKGITSVTVMGDIWENYTYFCFLKVLNFKLAEEQSDWQYGYKSGLSETKISYKLPDGDLKKSGRRFPNSLECNPF